MVIWTVSFYDETGAFRKGTTHPRTYCPTREGAKKLARLLRTYLGKQEIVDGKGKVVKPTVEKLELDPELENCKPRGDLCSVLNRLDGYAFSMPTEI